MNKDGIELLKEFEGWRPEAYIPVPGDVPTLGYGFTKGVKMGDKMSRQAGEARLKKEVLSYELGVEKGCAVTPNENQLAAMTCLAYNIGLPSFLKSTVLKAHNRGDGQAASRAFGLWNRSGNKVYAGLTRRRAAEASLYLKPVPEEQEDHPMPQTIDAESTLAKSPTAIAGGLTTVGGAVAGVSAIADQVGGIAGQASNVAGAVKTGRGWFGDITAWIGLTPLEFACIALVAIGVVVMVFRWRQRSAGWA